MLLLFTVFCSFRLQFSRLGRAWIAIREDETAAAAMGVPLMRTKTWAYASGAFFGGIAGAYYATFKSATFPGDFFFNISVFILCMVILGGMGNIWGVIVGGAFLAYLNQEGLANTGQWLNTNISFIGHLQLPGSTAGPRRAALRLRHLRVDHPDRDALPARRAHPVAARRRGDARRRPRRAALRRHARGDRARGDGAAARDTATVLVATDVRKEFGGLIAVNDVNFTVPRGKVISLIGPNGAGKTTFFNMLTGVYKPTAGQIIFLGEDVTGKPPHAITARGIGRTFQNIRLFQNMTALENVLVGMHSRHEGEPLQLDPPHAVACGARSARRARARARAARLHRPRGARRARSRATCRTATSAGSRWRARSRPSRSCCCSTSRRPA